MANSGSGNFNYVYDGGGERVEKSSGSTGTLYWRALDGSVLEETDTSGNWANDYIYFDGQRLGQLVASQGGAGYICYADALGSEHTITGMTGQVCYDADFYPFGGELNFKDTCGQNYRFAGMERDPETSNDHTWFRQYDSALGRWLSPDPLGGDIMNPQSLNRYAYALNNPTTFIDPLGLCTAGQNGCVNLQGTGPCVQGDEHCHPITCGDWDCADEYYGGWSYFGGCLGPESGLPEPWALRPAREGRFVLIES